MGKTAGWIGLGALVAVAGCGGGGGGGPGDPLLATTLTGEYKGQPFTPMFGFATLYQGSPLIGLGDGPLNCASPERPDPPPGTNALVTIPAFEAGTYSSRLVEIVQNITSFEGMGSNGGTVVITTVSTESVTGSVAFSYTDDQSQTYGINGTFEVARCP